MKNKFVLLALIVIMFALPLFVFADSIGPNFVPYSPSPRPDFINYILSLIITIIIEVLATFYYVKKYKKPKNIILTILWANLVSLTLLHLLMFFTEDYLIYSIILGEILVFIFEAFIVKWRNKESISTFDAITLSLINNALSIFWGGILVMLIEESYFINYF